MDEGVVERLVRLGLTQYEARAYVALARRSGSTPAEVAKVAGVPRPRIYDVVASLVAKGLVEERPGSAAKYVAKPPANAVETLVEAHRDRLQMLEADAQAAASALLPAYIEGSTQGDPLDYVELIRAPEAIAKRFSEFLGSVERELLSFSKAPFAVRIEENDVGLRVARVRDVRTVYEMSSLDDPVIRDGIVQFIRAGERARFVDELPMKLCIMDERVVMLAMTDPLAGETVLTTLIIENAQLARCLKIAFDQVWSSGLTFEMATQRRGAPSAAGNADAQNGS